MITPIAFPLGSGFKTGVKYMASSARGCFQWVSYFLCLKVVCLVLAFASLLFCNCRQVQSSVSSRMAAAGLFPTHASQFKAQKRIIPELYKQPTMGRSVYPRWQWVLTPYKIEKDGFKTETQTALTLEVGQDLVVNPDFADRYRNAGSCGYRRGPSRKYDEWQFGRLGKRAKSRGPAPQRT